ncbi:hypothetical protein EYC84_006913 [Monilinia fructicola]|uniref:Uncharacterized protein n=1 Tax=Monilinia fructicola TaxID=38448 RepID=A0A5M9K5G9_MONFR|nr:hypothetical protein EYC84_006913 [Monilinia fructicola]
MLKILSHHTDIVDKLQRHQHLNDQRLPDLVQLGLLLHHQGVNLNHHQKKATEDDARRHHIPAGYSLKNWDPAEEPIMLLGSVFDANSLGKWIYDWTVYHHGPATPLSDMAGELWLLLIQLAGKVKRAEECMSRIRQQDNREMVEDFIESGERLTDKLKKLLKACEAPMLKAGRNGTKSATAQLGKNAGTEFVDSIFGRDRQLEQTEKFMASKFYASRVNMLKQLKQDTKKYYGSINNGLDGGSLFLSSIAFSYEPNDTHETIMHAFSFALRG